MHNNKQMSKIIWLGPHRRCTPSIVLSLYFAVDGHVPSKVSVPLPVAGQNPLYEVSWFHMSLYTDAGAAIIGGTGGTRPPNILVGGDANVNVPPLIAHLVILLTFV